MAPTESSSLSEDSKNLLEAHVKKGKVCKFFLICKATGVETLVVFKKGASGPLVARAKKDGYKGSVHHGVVTGAGANLFFQFAGTPEVAAAMKVEGCEQAPPTKSAKLRDFLKDNSLSLKPSFHIITDVKYAPDPDADSDIPVPPPPPGSEVSDEPPTVAVTKPATTSSSTPAPAAPSPAAVESPPGASATSVDPSRAAKLAEALQKLKPLVDKVINGDPSLKPELFASMAGIATKIKNKQYDEAQENLVSLGKRLNALLAAPPATPSDKAENDKAAELFAARQKVFEKNKTLLQAQAADRERATKLGALWQFALDQAESKNFASANKALDGLETAISEVLTATAGKSDAQRLGIREGIVAEMRQKIADAKVRWDLAIEHAADEIRKVQDGVREADPQLANELDRYLGEYVGRLDKVAVRCAQADTPELVEQRLAEAQQSVRELLEETRQDDVIDFLDSYEYATVNLRATFVKAFADLDQQLQAPRE